MDFTIETVSISGTSKKHLGNLCRAGNHYRHETDGEIEMTAKELRQIADKLDELNKENN